MSDDPYTPDESLGLTEKQRRACELCLQLTANMEREKRFLISKLIEKGVYSKRHQAKDALKYLLRSEKIPLAHKKLAKVVNTGEASRKEENQQ